MKIRKTIAYPLLFLFGFLVAYAIDRMLDA